MNLNYRQTSGTITNDAGELIATGWAGNHQGKNNHAMEEIHCVGPLPVGVYQVGSWGEHAAVGEDSATLTQIQGETYGRDEFLIHGPAVNPAEYGQESKGCIVVPHVQRLTIMALRPDTITVYI